MNANTQLFEACENRCINKVKDAVTQGADVNAFNSFGETPIYTAIESIEWLGYTLDKNPTEKEKNELFDSEFPKVQEIILFLIEHGADVNLYGEGGHYPLEKALWMESFVVTRFLLEHGADPNINTDEKEYPQHASCVLGTYYDWFICDDRTDKREEIVEMVRMAGGRLYKFGYNRITGTFSNKLFIEMSPSNEHLFRDRDGFQCGSNKSVNIEIKANEYLEFDLSTIDGLKEWHDELISDYFEDADLYTEEEWIDWNKRGLELAYKIKSLLPENVDLYYFSENGPVIHTREDGSKYWHARGPVLVK